MEQVSPGSFFGEPSFFPGSSYLFFPQPGQTLHFIKGIPVCFYAFPSCSGQSVFFAFLGLGAGSSSYMA